MKKRELDSGRKAVQLIRRSARRFFVGIEGPGLTEWEKGILAYFPPGGLVLFKRNLKSAPQTRRLIRQLREAVAAPILVAIDQEGGKVDRLAAFRKPSPSAKEIAAKGETSCERAGEETGRILRSIGFDMDLAPVVDLEPGNADAIGFGGRSFGSDPSEVSKLAGAFLRGLHAGGVAGCLKHFPGLGRASVNSHRHLPIVEAPKKDLVRDDLRPFAALAGEALAIMVSHAAYPALDPARRAASVSPKIIRDSLGRRLQFGGAVLSDDLEMQALESVGTLTDRARAAFLAGSTFLLLCSQISAFPEAALGVAGAAKSKAGAALLEDAETRDRKLRRGVRRFQRNA